MMHHVQFLVMNNTSQIRVFLSSVLDACTASVRVLVFQAFRLQVYCYVFIASYKRILIHYNCSHWQLWSTVIMRSHSFYRFMGHTHVLLGPIYPWEKN